jgi:selT/selW/selH-like putative selenoprotein
MAKYYHEVKRFIESKYPEFRGNISGGNYPPGPFAEISATIAGYLWIGGIALLLAGDIIFRTLGITPPSWYETMKANKVMCFIGLFIMNSLGSSMMTTGAFEVYLNDEHVLFSRLQSGGTRLPSGDDLMRSLKEFGIEPL